MKVNIKSAAKSVIAVIPMLVSACGGGGDNSAHPPRATTPTPLVVVTPPVTTLAQDLQTTVPAPSYAANSEALAFFNAFNTVRAQLGLGLLAESVKLNTAAANHGAYQAQNLELDLFATDSATGRPAFHIESQGRPGFTGVQELDRAKYAQYAGMYVGETGSFGLGQGAVKSLNDLMSTVYHRAAFLYQSPRDIGVFVGTDKNQTVIVEFGFETKGQFNASTYFGSYPADKQTGVPLVAASELPNPLQDVALSDYPTKTSYPVNVVSVEGSTLAVSSFTVTESGQSAPLEVRLITKERDPNKYLQGNYAFVVGRAPFKANTTYNVMFSGTVNGIAVSRSWSFSTGVL